MKQFYYGIFNSFRNIQPNQPTRFSAGFRFPDVKFHFNGYENDCIFHDYTRLGVQFMGVIF